MKSRERKPAIEIKRRPTPQRIKWPKWAVALIGAIPDSALAAKMGVGATTVRKERARRGILPFYKIRSLSKWPPENIALLGRATDTTVAKILGVRTSTVTRQRWKLGIAAYSSSGKQAMLEWTDSELALLGTTTDTAIGAKLGITPTTVGLKRQSLGIPPFRPAPAIAPKLPKKALRLLGKRPDTEIAKSFGLAVHVVHQKRRELGIAPFLPSGQVVITPELRKVLKRRLFEVQQLTGLPPNTIFRLRKRLGIKAEGTVVRDRWTPEILARLGKEVDRKIAEELGVTPTAVTHKRHKLGIPSFGGKREWAKAEIALLGTATDEEIARRLRRRLGDVVRERATRGIPRYELPHNRSRKW